jgi:predicted O-methyltransferase YrrM
MRERGVRALEKLHLAGPARAAKASGWLPWIPLVPAGNFFDSCVTALRALRWHQPDRDIGHYCEFGTSRGTSLATMHAALQREGLPHVRLFGFDSFEGLPAEAVTEGWRPGAFKSTLSATRHHLTRRGVDWSRVTLVKGWFKDTLSPATREQLKIGKASTIMIDCDIGSATRDALNFVEPLIHERTVMFLDDWNAGRHGGQRHAFEDFLYHHPDISAEPLPTYTATARVFMLVRGALAGWMGYHFEYVAAFA